MHVVIPGNVRIVVDPPGRVVRAGPLRWLRRRPTRIAVLVLLALAFVAGLVAWWWTDRPTAAGPADGAPLVVGSVPAAATVLVDGRARGRTPTTLHIPPGRHHVVLQHGAVFDAHYDVDVPPEGMSLAADLWRRQPLVRSVRPNVRRA